MVLDTFVRNVFHMMWSRTNADLQMKALQATEKRPTESPTGVLGDHNVIWEVAWKADRVTNTKICYAKRFGWYLVKISRLIGMFPGRCCVLTREGFLKDVVY